MIKLIMFDLWNTILEDQGPIVKNVKDILKVKMPYNKFLDKFERAFLLKEYRNIEEGFLNVCKTFKIKNKEKAIKELSNLYVNRKVSIFKESRNVLSTLRKNYKLALISNADFFHTEGYLKKFNIRKYFNFVALSYKTKMLKQDLKIFRYVLKKFNVKPSEALMIGDSFKTDILSAEKVGIKGILIDRKNRFKYKNKIRNLIEIKRFL